MELNTLKQRLDTLAVFRALLDDPVVAALRQYLSSQTAPDYAAFVSALYAANGGALDAHLLRLCAESDNVCARMAARGEPLPDYLHQTLADELQTLQAAASLSHADLQQPLQESVPLPGFASPGADLSAAYQRRLSEVGKRGFGMFARHTMFLVDDGGALTPVAHPDPILPEDLVDYERERTIVLENTKALLAGKPAANMLLTGDAGTGKSSTVKAVANALAPEGLRLAELRREQLPLLPAVLAQLAENPLKFILFIDDLSFLTDDESFNALKAALEGGLSARSKNVVIYATSNRRHLVKERFSDREGDDVHCSDTLQELKSLSDRFGLQVTFQRPDKATYLHIVEQLARDQGLALPSEALRAEAERAALSRGGRSARLARQVVDQLLSAQ